jgi:hypothetical protein
MPPAPRFADDGQSLRAPAGFSFWFLGRNVTNPVEGIRVPKRKLQKRGLFLGQYLSKRRRSFACEVATCVSRLAQANTHTLQRSNGAATEILRSRRVLFVLGKDLFHGVSLQGAQSVSVVSDRR